MKFRPILMTVCLIALIGGGYFYYQKLQQKPQTTSHLHGDEEIEDHTHVHSGPFSHDHFHEGIADGTKHSHPHQHPEEHVQVPEEFKDWAAVGHVHDEEKVSLFLARGVIEEKNLNVYFSKLTDGELSECSLAKTRLVGKIYVGHTKLDDLLFEWTGDALVHKNVADKLTNPLSTLVFDEIEIESHQLKSIVVPVALGTKVKQNSESQEDQAEN